MLRTPGHSLRERYDDLEIDFFAATNMMLLMPLLAYSAHISQSYWAHLSESSVRTIVSVVVVIVISTILGWHATKTRKEQNICKLGWEGELKTAEELNQLMLDGCRVYHDLIYQYGNIDHILVCSTGVYTINTKTWSKLKTGLNRAKVAVDRPNQVFRFSQGRTREIPVQALQMEAKWLANNLSNSTGKTVRIIPILALPGWFIDGASIREDYGIINPKKCKSFFLNRREILSSNEVQQIAFQVEQLVRNVTPSFKSEKKWKSS
ncbi:MAG: NERD domain-containing protein [Planctomycetaceae bacterium]|nr:NERD domain-containing protein [Planctomycetaceae bacterium]